MEDRCVCCGEIIPEGDMVCINCRIANNEAPCVACQKRSEGCHVYCREYLDYYNARRRLNAVKMRQRNEEQYYINTASKIKRMHFGRKDQYEEK